MCRVVSRSIALIAKSKHTTMHEDERNIQKYDALD
jgi:hypothetical protein